MRKTASDGVVLLGYAGEGEQHMSGRVIDPDGVCFTLMAGTHGYGFGNIIEYDDTGVKGSNAQGTEGS